MTNHELSSFEKAAITACDLLISDAPEIARKTSLSVEKIRRLQQTLIDSTKPSFGITALDRYKKQRFLTTGDAALDKLLGGGIPLGYVTEFVGESGVGKSQLMTQLCITTQLPVAFGGLKMGVVYFSTESGFITPRAVEISHDLRSRYSAVSPPVLSSNTLDNIHIVVCPDLELQDHIIYYQLPVLLAQNRNRIGCVIIDSIAANYRAEFDNRREGANAAGATSRASDMGIRSRDLWRLSAHLKKLAEKHDVAIVVANQVSDRISRDYELAGVMGLDYQGQYFNGWDDADESPKVPALGLVWSNALHTRVAMLKVPNGNGIEDHDRKMRIVFSPFVKSQELGYEITQGGVRSVGDGKSIQN